MGGRKDGEERALSLWMTTRGTDTDSSRKQKLEKKNQHL